MIKDIIFWIIVIYSILLILRKNMALLYFFYHKNFIIFKRKDNLNVYKAKTKIDLINKKDNV